MIGKTALWVSSRLDNAALQERRILTNRSQNARKHSSSWGRDHPGRLGRSLGPAGMAPIFRNELESVLIGAGISDSERDTLSEMCESDFHVLTRGEWGDYKERPD